jgi:pyruvate dehydrogenase E2 component (dihydrolipoamide acetyltransferase)
VSVAQIVEVRLPRLSDSMEEGTIVRWLRQSGDAVAEGEAIVEIETDKATMEYEAEASGTLQILAQEGATVSLGATIARLLPEGAAAPPPPRDRPERILATPVARRVASDLGVELTAVTATGRRGQIMKADVESFAASMNGGNGAAPESDRSRVQLTRTQRTIARRMAESRAVVPNFELVVDVDMAACLKLRARLADHHDPAPSVNDMVIRACALALREHARVNGSYRDDAFVLHERVNVGFAVAAADSLLVPVVTDADRRPLTEIAGVTSELAVKAREGRIAPGDLSSATFTVSNLGMFGIDRFTAIINAPQAAILAIGAATERPVVHDGVLGVGTVMTATLAADHRILYGSDAARFLTDVRDRLQAPIGLLS